MKCVQCGMNYMGMKQVRVFDCPKCGELKPINETN